MSTPWRVGTVLVVLVLMSATGCDKSSTSGAGDSYSKKLVGTWETTNDPKDDKEGPGPVTVEFKPDGAYKVAMGPLEMTGTWKLAAEAGKTLTVNTELTFAGFGGEKDAPKPDQKSFTIVFEDDNTIVMSKVEGKPETKKLKRKA
jgi:hypothetical protein